MGEKLTTERMVEDLGGEGRVLGELAEALGREDS